MAARAWAYWVFIALLVILHLTIHLAVGVTRAPDLMTVALLLGVRRLSGAQGAAFGLALGILHDSLSLLAFGVQAVVYVILGFLGARSRDIFFGDSFLFVVLYLFVGKWLHDVLYYLIAGPTLRGEPVARFLVESPIAALWATAAGAVALLLYRTISGDR